MFGKNLYWEEDLSIPSPEASRNYQDAAVYHSLRLFRYAKPMALGSLVSLYLSCSLSFPS